MKQFNLEEYLKNPSKKVITRDGENVRIVCTDVKGKLYPILALVEDRNEEIPTLYTKDGEFNVDYEHSCDLFFATEKHEGWMNLYKDSYSPTHTGVVHNSEEKAIKNRQENAVATIKIEWEE